MNTLEQLRKGQLSGAREIKIAGGLRKFPREIFALADTLEVLDLSGNALSALPDDFARLHKLRIFFASNNRFTEVPEVLGQCPDLSMIGFKANRIRHLSGQVLPAQLRWLILTDNALTALPAEMGRCTQLQKLMLAGNQLRELPPELASCHRLELLRISANQLSALPKWLLQMPRLSWLACGGNPFTWNVEQQALENAPLPSIPWANLQLEQQLGMGASGVIHQAQMITHAGHSPVAVKLFKARVTSDGWPQTEMAISLLTGAHPHLLPAIGQITGHPSGVQGLVMPLIDPKLKNLAGPPSLESCTRDTYAPSTHISLQSLLKLIPAIASAAQHLHQSGIVHGDLYAHNILHDGQGFALLGDFGASSLGAATQETMAHALQRIEVRAFGCLLEELMERCDQPLPTSLLQLRDDCLCESPAQRPLFQDILNTLYAHA